MKKKEQIKQLKVKLKGALAAIGIWKNAATERGLIITRLHNKKAQRTANLPGQTLLDQAINQRDGYYVQLKDLHLMLVNMKAVIADKEMALASLREQRDVALKGLEELKEKYLGPAPKCNAGHENTLPLALWDCPRCVDVLRKELEAAKRIRIVELKS